MLESLTCRYHKKTLFWGSIHFGGIRRWQKNYGRGLGSGETLPEKGVSPLIKISKVYYVNTVFKERYHSRRRSQEPNGW